MGAGNTAGRPMPQEQTTLGFEAREICRTTKLTFTHKFNHGLRAFGSLRSIAGRDESSHSRCNFRNILRCREFLRVCRSADYRRIWNYYPGD